MSTLSSDPWMISAPQISMSTPSAMVPCPEGDLDVDDAYPRDLGKVGIVLCAVSAVISVSSISSVVMYVVG